MPIVMEMGRVGGTVMVIKSSPLLTRVQGSIYLWSLMVRIVYDTTVRKKRKNKNFLD